MVINAVLMTVLTVLSRFGPVGLASLFGLTDRATPAGEQPIVPLAWSWLIVLGTAVTFALGLLLGPGKTRLVEPPPAAAQEASP
jgi:hypothetical protein